MKEKSNKLVVRAKTFEAWMKNNFTIENFKDMVEHGIDTGWNCLTWYDDTVVLFEKFKVEIFDRIDVDADNFGHTYGEMMQFLCDKYNACDYKTFANAMVWYMASQTAYDILRKKFPGEY